MTNSVFLAWRVMHWLRVIVTLLIVALLQTTLLPAFEVGHVRPDLLFVVALYVIVSEPVERRSRWGAFWVGWAAGLIGDVYSAGSHLPFGSTALVFGLMSMAMSKLGEELFLDSVIAQVLVLGPVCLATQLVLGVVLAVETGGPAGAILWGGFWTACYSALAAPLVFAAMRRIEWLLGARPRKGFGRV